MNKVDIAIIGGGPAGLAAALSAYENGCKNILILERDKELGGILRQCIHNGFGLHTFKEELTGPEYAKRYADQVIEKGIPYQLNTMVIDLSKEHIITCVSAERGLEQIEAKAVILAMGCRERPRGALGTPGTRCAGIYTAGTAQKLVNLEGKMPGKRVVILGSGDIGLIMARRMTFMGAKVEACVELMPYSSGLKRNIVQCLDDYNIPLLLRHTVTEIHGKERLTGVTVSEVDEKNCPISGTEKYIDCDTLLLSVGLLPENELTTMAGVEISPATSGAVVNEQLETSVEGIFSCGNVLHVHDLVDYVSEEAKRAGYYATLYVKEAEREKVYIPVITGNGVGGAVPQKITRHPNENVTIMFRPRNVCKDAEIVVRLGEEILLKRKARVLTPGEMVTLLLKKDDFLKAKIEDVITVEVREAEV